MLRFGASVRRRAGPSFIDGYTSVATEQPARRIHMLTRQLQRLKDGTAGGTGHICASARAAEVVIWNLVAGYLPARVGDFVDVGRC